MKRKTMSLLLILSMVLTLLPTTAFAASVSDKGTAATDINNTNAMEIAYGGQNWRVIGNNGTGVASDTGTMTLLAKDNIGTSVFSSSTNEYSGSALQTAVDLIASHFDAREKATIIPRTLSTGTYLASAPYCDGVAVTKVDNALLWPLSTKEATEVDVELRKISTSYWWLRSPGNGGALAAFVTFNGSIVIDGWATGNDVYVRPAFKLDMSKVLFTSAAASGKAGAAGSMLSAVATPSGAQKLTVLDSGLALGTAATTDALTAGSTVSVSYTGATTGKTLSAIVVNTGTGAVTYYGKLVDSIVAADGTASVTLPAGFDSSTMTLKLFVEEINGDNSTDYASAPVPVTVSAPTSGAVTYDGNGATSGTAPTDASSPYSAGATVTVLGNTGNLAKTGYTFAGWSLTSMGAKAYDGTGSETFTMSTTTATQLYAVWTANTYTVTFKYQDGTTTETTKAVTYGQTYGALPTPTRAGYTLKGWYTAASGGTKVTAATAVAITAAQDLYAQWTAVSQTITYNANGGTGTMENQAAGAGTSITLSNNKFTKQGLAFGGWAITEGGSAVYTDGQTIAMPAGGLTLYAKWTEISSGGVVIPIPTKHTVSYNSNGSTGGTVPASASYDENATVTVSDNTGKLVKTGTSFKGWNTKADGTGTFYAPNSTFAMGTSDITLYAEWDSSTSLDKGNWATGGQNGYIVAYNKATEKALPMSYYDDESGYVFYKTNGTAEIQAKYNFITFSDVDEGFWASDSIWFLASREIINGMGDGRFQPSSNVTRAQFVKILASMVDGLDLDAYPSANFSDVVKGKWYEKYVNWAVSSGIIEGYGNGRFGPNVEMTREQMCVIILRFCKYINYNLGSASTTHFDDENSIDTWARDAVSILQGSGLVNGKTTSRFDPLGKATRAEVATICSRLLRAMLSNMQSTGKIEWIA